MNWSGYLWFAGQLGCSSPVVAPEAPVAPRAPDRPDLVLVTLDTTRADRLGSYGYALARTDTLDRLAAAGRRYARVWAPVPLTIPSHAALFTGRGPHRLGVRSNGAGVLGDQELTLAEHLKAQGYATAASVGAFVTTGVWGFQQGFDDYFQDLAQSRDNLWHSERPASAVVDDALRWVEQADPARPKFLWVHLYDAHFPYRPLDPAYLAAAPDRPYDAELAYVDDQVERLLAGFDLDRTVVVVVGDHGEALGEHQELDHGLFVYDSTQRVPWLMAGPGIEPAVIDEPASLLDVAPTVLQVLGQAPLPAAEGLVVPGAGDRSLYLESWQLAERYGIAAHRALVRWPYKLIVGPRPELYRLDLDPQEALDRAEQEPERVRELSEALAALNVAPPTADPAHPDAGEVAARLAALGYVEGGFEGDLVGPLPDAKDRASLLGKAQQAERLTLKGDLPGALALMESLAEEYPDILEFSSTRAMLLGRLGRAREALPLLEASLVQDPDNAMLELAYASALARAARFREASVLFQRSAERLTYVPRLRAMAVRALLRQPETDAEGLDLGMMYLQLFPDDPHLAGTLGVRLVELGQPARALPLLQKGLSATTPEPEVAFHLASAALGRGDREESLRLLSQEIQNYPGNHQAVLVWCRFRAQDQAWEDIARVTALALATDDDAPLVWHAHAQALFNLKRYDEVRPVLTRALERWSEHPELLLLSANLLHAEGRTAEAKAVFEEAQRAKAAREASASGGPARDTVGEDPVGELDLGGQRKPLPGVGTDRR